LQTTKGKSVYCNFQLQVPDGSGGTMTDEPALSQAIARRMGLAVDKVGLPWVERKAYLEE
jgi:hypothetical protein